MKVTMATAGEFIDEMLAEAANVHQATVRLRTDREPRDREKTLFDVRFSATCVIAKEDGDYLLEFESPCGEDEPGVDDNAGSDIAAQWHDQIRTAAEQHGLTVKKGRIELE